MLHNSISSSTILCCTFFFFFGGIIEITKIFLLNFHPRLVSEPTFSQKTKRAHFVYNGNEISTGKTGTGGLNELAEEFKDNEKSYAYLRVVAGDEESKRAKFVFISWCGPEVKALAKAKQSVEKASVKDILRSYAVEIHYTDKEEVNEDRLMKQVVAAGGANYGTGSRN